MLHGTGLLCYRCQLVLFLATKMVITVLTWYHPFAVLPAVEGRRSRDSRESRKSRLESRIRKDGRSNSSFRAIFHVIPVVVYRDKMITKVIPGGTEICSVIGYELKK